MCSLKKIYLKKLNLKRFIIFQNNWLLPVTKTGKTFVKILKICQMKDLCDKKAKLILFAGDPSSISDITDRQKNAIEKMVFLNKYQFEDLITDIADEIDYRLYGIEKNDQELSKKLNSKNKLRLLDDNNLKELTTDVLLVMEHSIPFLDQQHNGQTLINDIENILSNIKIDKNEESLVLHRIEKSGNFHEMLEFFFDYTEKKFKEVNFNTSIIERMRKENNKVENEHMQIKFYSIFSPHLFLDLLNQYSCSRNDFIYRKNNLQYLLNNKNDIPEKIIYKEMSELFYIILQDKQVTKQKYNILLKEDSSNLLRSIEELVNVIKTKLPKNDLLTSGANLIRSSEIFYNKISQNELKIDDLLIEKYLKQHNKIVSSISEGIYEGHLFNSVIEFVYFIKELFNILQLS